MTHPAVGYSSVVRSSLETWPDSAGGRPPRNTGARRRPGAPAGPSFSSERSLLLAPVLAPVLALLIGVSGFQSGPVAAAADLSDVLPILRTLPAPASIVEGRRLNYLVEVATVPSAYFYEWVDQAGTTNDYQVPSPSGRGYTQVDVIGVTPQFVGLRVQPWLFHNFTGPLVPLFGSDEALVGYAGGGDWYAHPQALATVTPTLQQGLKILRMPLRIGGRVFDALRIQSEGESARAVVCYDLATGYLIYKAGAVSGEQGVTLSQASLLSIRDLALPWARDALPTWVALHPRLRYDGTYTAAAIGSLPFTVPLSAEITPTAHARNWFVYDQTTTLGSLPGTPPTVEHKTLASGLPSLAPLCLPVPLPAGLTVGQTLDRDDVTDALLTVTRNETAHDGSGRVGLRMSVGQIAWSETTYDTATGVALEMRTYSGASPLYYTATDLRLTELPPPAPKAPRLTLARLPGGSALVLSWPTESTRRYTLEVSLDAARTWTAVAGNSDRVGNNQPMTCNLDRPVGTAWYRVAVR